MRICTAKWPRPSYRAALGIAVVLLLFISTVVPGQALAASEILEISGDGVANPIILTRAELLDMAQHQQLYSVINTWPTKRWYLGQGVKLYDLLQLAGVKEEATVLRFTALDGFTVAMTWQELFIDQRFLFPKFKKEGADEEGHIPGSPEGKVPVEAMVGLVIADGSTDPAHMNSLNSLQLMLGQRAPTEQTGNLFVKYLHKIEVLTVEPDRWDAPVANPGPETTVAQGGMITLSNATSDDDKMYYTTDGTTPTLDSPMYNWIASRWWPARAEVLGMINSPIGPIERDTVIKAVTIGPGKLDSPVAVYHYRVAGGDGPSDARVIELKLGELSASIDGQKLALEAAPYLNLGTGRTLVPLRFIAEAFQAAVGWTAENSQITIRLGGQKVVLTIGSDQAILNGSAVKLDCPPELHPSGRTFVPLRFISEALGAAEVRYDDQTGVITIRK